MALEVVRLMEPNDANSVLHPRPLNDLLTFWNGVKDKLHGIIVGIYLVRHCPVRPELTRKDWKSLEDKCAEETIRIASSISKGQSGVFEAPDELRGTCLFKHDEGDTTLILECVSFVGPTSPVNNEGVLRGLRQCIIPNKDKQLAPAKREGKNTTLLVVLDYPLVEAASLTQAFQETGCTNIDHIYLAHSWTGVPHHQRIQKVA